ncbi:hypothetical protein D3C85_1467320 [compost metagenome]
MRLNVCVLSTEKLLRAVTSDVFHDVYVLTATIVSFAWVAFCVFVRQNSTHSLKNSLAHDVLGSD